MTRARSRILVVIAATVSLTLAGCVEEKLVRKDRPFFGSAGRADDIGSVLGTKPASDRGEPSLSSQAEDMSTIVLKQPDGSVQLRAGSGRHLLVHVYNTLMDDQRDLFTQQVLSEVTKKEYRERGLDPSTAYDTLREMENDIVDLCNAMPFGERTPGTQMKSVGGRVLRLEAPPEKHASLRLIAMDMVMERGSWRLRWFVQNHRSRQ
jgi:hypothetical protein